MKLHHPLVFLLSLQVNALPSEQANTARAAIAAQARSSYASDRHIIADAMNNALTGTALNATHTAAVNKMSDLTVDVLADFASYKVLDDLDILYADIDTADAEQLAIGKRDKQFLIFPYLLYVGLCLGGLGTFAAAGAVPAALHKKARDKKKKKEAWEKDHQ